jgi:hypothetical protein
MRGTGTWAGREPVGKVMPVSSAVELLKVVLKEGWQVFHIQDQAVQLTVEHMVV